MASNKKIGNDFESEFCEMLFEHNFWVHNLTQNQAGQPADVIAARNGKAYLIDCKVCENDRFPFSRIESNQHTAMRLWKESGNGYGIFALKLDNGEVYMFNHDLMIALSIGQASIGKDMIEHYGTPFGRWVENCR